jgi:hypothetical protein
MDNIQDRLKYVSEHEQVAGIDQGEHVSKDVKSEPLTVDSVHKICSRHFGHIFAHALALERVPNDGIRVRIACAISKMARF